MTGRSMSEQRGITHHEVTDRRLSPLTTVATTVEVALAVLVGAIPVAIVLGVLMDPIAVGFVILVALVLIGSGALAGWLRWRHTSYTITPDRFVLRSGIFVRRTRTFARERIRAVDLSAHPVHRVFGLVAVKIGTAEQTGDTGSADLSPLPTAEAERLHDELIPRGGVDSELARFSPAWLGYAPLTWMPLIITGGVYALVGQFAEGFGQTGWRWAVDTAQGVGILLVLLVVLGIPLLIGVIGAVVVHAELWWNHRLDRDGDTLRVRRGLLTSRTISLPEHRLRGIRITEPLGVRIAGAAQLEALAIGLQNQNQQDNKDKGSQNNVLLPYAPRPVVDRAGAAVLRVDDPPTGAPLTPHPQAAFWRRLRRVCWAVAGWVVVTGALAFLVVPEWWPGVLAGAILLGALGSWWAYDLAKNLGHRLDEQRLVTRSGSLRRTTDVLNRDAIIGWNIQQSIFQKRQGLVTLIATTGAGSGSTSVVDTSTTQGLVLADSATPDLLDPFLTR